MVAIGRRGVAILVILLLDLPQHGKGTCVCVPGKCGGMVHVCACVAHMQAVGCELSFMETAMLGVCTFVSFVRSYLALLGTHTHTHTWTHTHTHMQVVVAYTVKAFCETDFSKEQPQKKME